MPRRSTLLSAFRSRARAQPSNATLWLLLFGALLCRTLPCAAQPAAEFDPQLRRDLIADASLLALDLVVDVAWPTPSSSRWTHVSRFDLRVADRLGARNPLRAQRASDALLGISLLSGTALSLFGPWLTDSQTRGSARDADKNGYRWRGLPDFLVALQAVLSTGLIDQALKRTTARPRPAIHFDALTGTHYTRHLRLPAHQRYLSFYSGHAGITASLATALVTLAYLRGHAYRHLAAALLGALSLATGTLRSVSHMHWATDVITGWGVGAALGTGLPLLHEALSRARRNRKTQARVPSLQAGTAPELRLVWIF